jgi:hypothetical protein
MGDAQHIFSLKINGLFSLESNPIRQRSRRLRSYETSLGGKAQRAGGWI